MIERDFSREKLCLKRKKGIIKNKDKIQEKKQICFLGITDKKWKAERSSYPKKMEREDEKQF